MSTIVDDCRFVIHMSKRCELSYPQPVDKFVDMYDIFTGTVDDCRKYNSRDHRERAMWIKFIHNVNIFSFCFVIHMWKCVKLCGQPANCRVLSNGEEYVCV